MGQGEGAVTVKPNDPGLRDLPTGNGESRSPEELERDADRIRNRMDETITEIEHRLSPDRLIDAAFAQVREGAGAFAVNLTQTLQRNPLPAVLMAAGVGWLLLGERGDKAARSTGKAESGHSRDAFEASPGVGANSLSEPAPAYGDMHMTRYRETSRREPTRRYGDGSGIRGRIGALGDRGRRSVEEIQSSAREQFVRARTGFEHMLDQEPLVLGVVAIAVGAVLGATLPTTRIEDRYLGPATDDVRERAGSYARQQWEKAKQVAATAASAAREELDREGLTASGLYEDAKERVGSVARATTEAAQREAERQNLGGMGSRPPGTTRS